MEDIISDATINFLEQLEKKVLANMNRSNFSITWLANEFALSRSQFDRKVKALSGLSTALFIRKIKLNKAKTLLKNTDRSISEIAYSCGYSNLAHFSQEFKNHYGSSPSQMRK